MSLYQVRMLVTKTFAGDDAYEAQDLARDTAEDAGFTVLTVEEPVLLQPTELYKAPEEDWYP